MSEELVGTINHYFAKPQVGVVKLTADIKVGDTLFSPRQSEASGLSVEGHLVLVDLAELICRRDFHAPATGDISIEWAAAPSKPV